MNKHPSKEIIGSFGDYLKDKKIVLCISSSVAAYRSVDLARLLMRYGAEVYVVMSRKTRLLLTEDLMYWATGNKVVIELSKELEHIQLADYGRSDLIIFYPCTANTIGKIANGIDDTSITSIASVALGSKIPIIIAPAMHEAMYSNPIVKENIEKLKEYVTIIEPDIIENKAKVASYERVVDASIRLLSSHKIKGKRILVTAGSTREYIDPIRVITNTASGRFGVEIAKHAYRLGADVTLIYGHGSATLPNLNIIRVDTTNEMLNAILSNLDNDILIMSASVTDYKPSEKRDKKIESRENARLRIELDATPKIINRVKEINPKIKLIAFKALYDVSKEELIDSAKRLMRECNADLVFANDVKKVSEDRIEGFVVGKDIRYIELNDKSNIARILIDEISKLYP
ncbi:MAG: bifunctional phosphopantothenoylcysteine decarboxylase/phosphopantothenate--cysteine ligase CoaBC [Candidatus Nitrosocaldaceae archaeon]